VWFGRMTSTRLSRRREPWRQQCFRHLIQVPAFLALLTWLFVCTNSFDVAAQTFTGKPSLPEWNNPRPFSANLGRGLAGRRARTSRQATGFGAKVSKQKKNLAKMSKKAKVDFDSTAAKQSRAAVVVEDHKEALELMSKRDFEGAIKYFRRAALMLKDFGIEDRSADQRDYGRICSNLAICYEETGDFPKAKSLIEESLRCLGKSLGTDDHEYATALTSLAALEWNSYGDADRAEVLFQQALSIYGRDLAQHHQQYCMAMHSLAALYQAQGKHALAQKAALEERRVLQLAAANR